MDLNEYLDFLEDAYRAHVQTMNYVNQEFDNVNHAMVNVFRIMVAQNATLFLVNLRLTRAYGNIPQELRQRIIALLTEVSQNRLPIEELLFQVDQMNDRDNVQIEEILDEEEESDDDTEPEAEPEPRMAPNAIEPTAPVQQERQPQKQVATAAIASNRCTDCGRLFEKVSGLKIHRARMHRTNDAPTTSAKGSKRSSDRLTERAPAVAASSQPKGKAPLRKVPLRKRFFCKWDNCQMTSHTKMSVLRHIQTIHFKLPYQETVENQPQLLPHLGKSRKRKD